MSDRLDDYQNKPMGKIHIIVSLRVEVNENSIITNIAHEVLAEEGATQEMIEKRCIETLEIASLLLKEKDETNGGQPTSRPEQRND